MARKANLLKTIKDPFVIQLDAGDLLFSSTEVPDLLADQSKLHAEYLLKSMDLVHHDAVVPGEKDFALGFQTFETLRKKSKTKFIAANLKKKNGSPYLDPNLVLSRKDAQGKTVRVGVFAVVGEALKWPKELKALSALEVAKQQVAELKKKSDYIVALTHQGFEQDEKLAKQVPGIDMIIGGHSQSFFQNPIQVKSTFIFQSSFRNQYVGVIPMTKKFDPATYKLVGLDAAYESPADNTTAMDRLVSEFKDSIAKLNSEQENALEMGVIAKNREQKYQTFPRCAECHYKQFDFWRKTQHVRALSSLIEKKQEKNKECLTCHTVGLGDPQGFSDVANLAQFKMRAPDDLEDDLENLKTKSLPTSDLHSFLESLHQAKSLKDSVKLQQSDPEGRPIKQAVRYLVRSWTPVQCENCHQPGNSHPFAGKYTKKVERTTCLQCHSRERAPEWYSSDGQPNLKLIDSKREMVACPAGDLSESED
jgi:hypothetical protein